ncbi:FAD binding domain-containing protein [Aspergillus sclerotiicarbonarius CBS 121057]|uniref:FAD binding domain-containing protein n=1 Tax=Aspergillus sclerotiicarbonarius (strain CBS 121057 / IBT 28362) TaxID=1448318 RepID=A0A319DY76_ASPSB|nr:FAD binding domain-containing protein [Aspergillus sclerotiicarbonarius CBS 121057]
MLRPKYLLSLLSLSLLASATPAEWQQFNASIDGTLFETTPIAAPCYPNSPSYNATTCQTVQSYYGDSVARGTHFGQTYWLNWETCHDSGCALLETNPNQTLYSTCSLGRLASYYIDVQTPTHIASALQFATSHNLRISIKNTGHDYYGRSSVPNTLSIWTHNLNSLSFHQNFTAHNCPSANGPNIGDLGAGVLAGDAYRYFNALGMDITGGFAQGGGVGSFTTTYGLMADNAVEMEVITSDGQLRVINACQDPELFWAMRGGGGGTYAILTKYRVQLYPSLPIHTYTFIANFTNVGYYSNASENVALREIITAHARNQLDWSRQLVSGQVEYFPEKFAIGLVLPYGDNGAKLRAATREFAAFLDNRTDLAVQQKGYTSYASYVDYLAVTAARAKVTEPPGIFSLLATRLIPRDVFMDARRIDQLVDGVLEGIATARSLLNLSGTQVVSETPVTNLDKGQLSSVNPAWRDAIWHVIHAGEWVEPMGEEELGHTTAGFLDMLQPLKRLSPGGGAYLNEAHYLEPEWQETYFGEFYERLLQVKRMYDPTHLFDCYKCVGWRGEDE